MKEPTILLARFVGYPLADWWCGLVVLKEPLDELINYIMIKNDTQLMFTLGVYPTDCISLALFLAFGVETRKMFTGKL